MKLHRILIALTLVNMMLLVFLLAQLWPVGAQGNPSVLRGRALEIVDEKGGVRSSITIQPATTMDGKTYSETALFRLITPAGKPVVKIGASETSADLGFVSDADRTQILIEAEGPDAIIKLTRDARQHVIKP